MKRYGNLYQDVCDKASIRVAIKRSSKGKTHRKEVRWVLSHQEQCIDNIHKMLKNKTYIPCKVRTFTRREGSNQKLREITQIKYYPDQIIQWCFIQAIDEYLMKSFYQISCGSIPGRGSVYGSKFINRWKVRDRKHTKYLLKMDITKFYHSIPHEIIRDRFNRKFKDPEIYWLFNTILNQWYHHDTDGKHIGLPIGFLTSQWFGNLVLSDLDHKIKQEFKTKYYIRYMDDMVLFGNNKKKLKYTLQQIKEYLKYKSLTLKNNHQVYKFDISGLDFMGFKYFRNKTILRKSLMYRMTRQVRKIKHKYSPTLEQSRSVMSYNGWIRHSNSYNFFKKHIASNISIKHARQVISKHDQTQSKIRKVEQI